MKASKLSGLNTLAYMGVEPVTPPQFVVDDRDPTVNDIRNFTIGTVWLTDNSAIVPAVSQRIWMLVKMAGNIATWVQLYPSLALAGGIYRTDAGDATPNALGVLHVLGGNNLGVAFKNMNTDGAGDTLHISLNTSIQQPDTSADGLEGMYGIGGNDFMHAYGTHNTFLGEQAGNRTLTVADATESTGIGFQVLTALTHGDKNSGLGESVLSACTEGEENTGFGWHSLSQLVGVTGVSGLRNLSLGSASGVNLISGNDNVLVGFGTGSSYVGAETNNILIGANVVGVAAENNKIRIGLQGTHDAAYMAGIYNTVPGGASTGVVLCDNNGQLGTGANPANGFVLVGGTNGPQWVAITGAGGTNINLGDHSIQVNSVGGGGGGLLTAHTDGGAGHDATVDVITSDMTFAGDGIIQTDGAAHVLTIGMATGVADGQVLISANGAAPVWANLTAGAGIGIVTGANSITISAPGGGGGTTTFHTDIPAPGGDAAPTVGGEISFLAGANTNTSVPAPGGSVVNINLNQSIIQPVTNAAGTQGLYSLGADRFMHNFGTFNTFIGQNAGNLTLLPGAQDNCGLGQGSLNGLTSGSQNTSAGSQSGFVVSSGINNSFYGYESGALVTSGSSNCAYGYQSLNGVVTGGNNLAIGTGAGSNLVNTNHSNIDIGNLGVGGDTNTMRIGTDGVGAGQQNSCYLAGVYNRATGATRGIVMIDNAYKMGSSNGADGQILIANAATGPTWANLTPGAGIAIVNGPGTITITNTGGGGGTVNSVTAGVNINMTGTAVNPVVNLNSSIQQPRTTVAGTSGIYALGTTALPGGYITDRFMHNYSAGANSYNTYVGGRSGNINVAHTATSNTGCGYNTLNACTSGENNSCGGMDSGSHMTTGSVNTSWGAESLHNCTTGGGNVAVGYASFFNLVSGDHNTGLGHGAGYGTTASNNTFIGFNAGTACTTSVGNVALGYSALDALTITTPSSGNNTALGGQSLGNLVCGHHNTAVGAGSGSALVGNADTEYYNLYLDNPGVAGENRTIRIGTYVSGVSQLEHTSAYCAGIHTGTSTAPQLVLVDTNGHLRGQYPNAVSGKVLLGVTNADPVWGSITSNDASLVVTPNVGAMPYGIDLSVARGINIAFLAYQNVTMNAVTGDGTIFVLGNGASPWTATYNYGGYLTNLAGGANLTFTAPIRGLYSITVQIGAQRPALPAPPPPPVHYVDPISIIAGSNTFVSSDPLFALQQATSPNPPIYYSRSYTITCYLTVGQTVRWQFMLNYGTKDTQIVGGGYAGTWVSGYMIRDI